MASITITLEHKCAGSHMTLLAAFGAQEQLLDTHTTEMLSPITEDDKLAFLKTALRYKKAADGLSNAQMLTLLQTTGIVVSL